MDGCIDECAERPTERYSFKKFDGCFYVSIPCSFLDSFVAMVNGRCCWQVIQAHLELLTADRANIMVLSKRYSEPGFCDHTETTFKTRYTVEGRFTIIG